VTIAYFVTFQDPRNPEARISEPDLARVADIVRTAPGLRKGLVFTPEQARDPYAKDPASPPLVLELYFADIADLEAAISVSGHLQALAVRESLPSLATAEVSQQAMIARAFPVPDPVFRTPPGGRPCTYLVHYPGWAEDLNNWLRHYIDSHTPVMARFPGIREVEVCTRLDWCSALPWPRVHYMQRNKVVFDSPAALTAALNSPVRQEMRADFAKFPAFSDGARHYPMATLILTP
jgi:uncharacterized protein (TIGR02118 family)